MVSPVGTVTTDDPEEEEEVEVSAGGAVTDAAGLAKALWTLGRETGSQTATEQAATASASVSGVGSLTFTATTPSLVPLTDMGASTYFGFPGGLYPGGNAMPQAHAAAGQAAAAAIEPLDVNGDPSPDGKYVLLSIGASNTMLISCNTRPLEQCPDYTFVGKALADPDVDQTDLAVVRGAGARAEFWESPANGTAYDRIRDRLSALGLSEQQVQVVWWQAATRTSITFLPDSDALAHQLVRRMGNIMRAFRSRYPNLRLVFFSSSIYLGYTVTRTNDETRYDREPGAYENGFAGKWLIQAQIDQMANGGTVVDARAGDLNYNTVAPWVGWGPYLWADGLNGSSDGHFWSGSDYLSDQIHLTAAGRQKAASLLMTFFKTSPQARCWFVAGETC